MKKDSADIAYLANLSKKTRSDIVSDSSILKSRVDINYKLFDGLYLDGIVARQSIFYGTLFRKCNITNSDFSRSDFEGVRFEDCKLVNVKFKESDIRSTKFVKTIMQNCEFNSAVCTDNLFLGCTEINNCHFESGMILNCTFEKCNIKFIKNNISTWLHVVFEESQLENLKFMDCTANYIIYNRCVLKNVTMNADALGLTFGLTKDNMENLDFGFLGRKSETKVKIGIDDFLEEYKNRGWLIHYLTLSLNFNPESISKIWKTLIAELSRQICSKFGFKKDDLEFIFKIMYLQHESHSLPFSIPIYAYDTLIKLKANLDLDEKNNVSLERRSVASGLQKSLYIASNMNDSLSSALFNLSMIRLSSNVRVRVVYPHKPQIPTIEYIKEILSVTKLNDSKLFLLKSEKGSWADILYMALNSLVAFYVSLYLVKGCLVQLNTIKEQSSKLLNRGSPSNFIQLAIKQENALPDDFKIVIKKMVSSDFTKNHKSGEFFANFSSDDLKKIFIEIDEGCD